MTEAYQVYRAVNRDLAPYGRFIRVSDSTASGIPDYYYLVRGASGWLECKLLPLSGRCPDHFTLEQLLWGEEETAHGGRWYLLGLCGNEWSLRDPVGARAFRDGKRERPTLLVQRGPFPSRDILKILIRS